MGNQSNWGQLSPLNVSAKTPLLAENNPRQPI